MTARQYKLDEGQGGWFGEYRRHSEARTKLWAYAKRMKWVPPGTEMKNGG